MYYFKRSDGILTSVILLAVVPKKSEQVNFFESCTATDIRMFTLPATEE